MFDRFWVRASVWITSFKRVIIAAWRELTGALVGASTYGSCLWLQTFWPQAPVWLYLLANGLCLIGLYPLCWKTPHLWPIWAAACALVAVMADILALLQPQILRLTLTTVIDLTGFALVISLATGVFMAWKSWEKREKPSKIGIFSYD